MAKKTKKNYINTSALKGSTPAQGSTSADDFDPDYSYVIKDLKRIGILAVSFFIILITLSFIL
jgi:hypothetical protein